MTQLERELSALFEDAASRVDIRPLPLRSPRAVAVNRVLAAGVTAALVAGVVLIAGRLGSDGANRGGAVTPAATQQLIDDVARTLGQPIRVASTFDSGQGAAQTTVTEMDVDRHELVTYNGSQPVLLIDGAHTYQGISSTERVMSRLPASAQWVEVPSAGKTADTMMQSVAGVSVEQLTNAISSGRVAVTQVARDTYRMSGTQPAPPGMTGVDIQTIHVSSEGLLDWTRIQSEVPTGNGGPVVHLVITARIRPLGHPITVTMPDPSTVISQRAYEAGSNSGQSCSGNLSTSPSPAPNGAAVRCSFSVSGTTTLRAGRARPKRR